MLQTQTVERKTFELLKRLQAESVLQDFHLAGGTALALYLGHRKSVDLDLFPFTSFEHDTLARFLTENFGFEADIVIHNTVKGSIDGVKVDLIAFPYPPLHPIHHEDNVRLYSLEDLAAMKLNAVMRGTRIKDFIDIACLSTKISLVEMLNAYEKRFQQNPVPPLRSLLSFDMINFNESVVSLNGSFEWKLIVERLEDMVRHQERLYSDFPFKV